MVADRIRLPLSSITRLQVVPYFSSGIVGRAKRERASITNNNLTIINFLTNRVSSMVKSQGDHTNCETVLSVSI